MKDLERRRILEHEFDEAKRGFETEDVRFRHLVDIAYDNSELAMKNMNRFSHDNGQDKFIAKLAKEPGFFGKLNSDIGTWQSLKPGATARRNTARQAQKELPDAVRKADKHLKDGRVARKSLEDEGHWTPQAVIPGKTMQARNRPQEARGFTEDPSGAGTPRNHPASPDKLTVACENPPHVPEKRTGADLSHAGSQKPSFSNRLRNQHVPSGPASADPSARERLPQARSPGHEEHQEPKPPKDHSVPQEKPVAAQKPSGGAQKPTGKISGLGDDHLQYPGVQKGVRPDSSLAGSQKKPSFSNRLRDQQAPAGSASRDQFAPERLQQAKLPSKDEHQNPTLPSPDLKAPGKPAKKPSFSQRLREPRAPSSPASKAIEKPRGKAPGPEIEM